MLMMYRVEFDVGGFPEQKAVIANSEGNAPDFFMEEVQKLEKERPDLGKVTRKRITAKRTIPREDLNKYISGPQFYWIGFKEYCDLFDGLMD
jgi:hypothetical protein